MLRLASCIAHKEFHRLLLIWRAGEECIFDADKRDRRAASEIAACAHRIDVKRFAVVPMVVAMGGETAINACEVLRVSQKAETNRELHDGVRSFATVFFGNAFDGGALARLLARLAESLFPMALEWETVVARFALLFGKRLHLCHHPGLLYLPSGSAGGALNIITRSHRIDAIAPNVRAQFGERKAGIELHDALTQTGARLTSPTRDVVEVIDMDSKRFRKLLALRWLRFEEISPQVHVSTNQSVRTSIIDQKRLPRKVFSLFINLFHARTFEP